ncbi:DUF1850 domain-containing protein [Domibacillus sp. A3M-37]|uniref:DUF1850 domain-containing protein n=1 Tax=Domibacillus sp. A3M-37 TaxID=2962037 RepID=UPI0020B8CE86|nr:DUF1850 domain-containing protein [Domibacillus sp. A3M-37]MCP3764391.1 DUF1850 domain-containing protein [Domibacillus sp. A3M-37]
MSLNVFKRFVVLCILLLLIAFLFYFPYKQVIAVTYQNQEQLLAYVLLKKNETFQIKYTHSIHLSDVVDSYRLSKEQIIQTELAYKDFAVGMPSNAEGNEVFEEQDGTYYIKNMNRQFPFIDLRIGQVKANHRLIYQDHVYTLAESIKPGSWVRISAKKITLWQQWSGMELK